MSPIGTVNAAGHRPAKRFKKILPSRVKITPGAIARAQARIGRPVVDDDISPIPRCPKLAAAALELKKAIDAVEIELPPLDGPWPFPAFTRLH